MSQISSTTDPRVSVLAASVEAAEPAIRVLGGRVCTVPYADVSAVVEILVDRRLNILEEFILRAAHELDPAPTLPDLAAMLGLDPLFVEASWQRVDTQGAVRLDDGGRIQLTDLGGTFYAKGQLPPTSIEEALDLRYWAATHRLELAAGVPRAAGPDPLLPGLGLEDEDGLLAALAESVTDGECVAVLTEAAGMGLHLPMEGRTLNEVKSWSVVASGVTSVVLLAVVGEEASDEGAVSLRVHDLVSGGRDDRLESILQDRLVEGRLALADFLPGLSVDGPGARTDQDQPAPPTPVVEPEADMPSEDVPDELSSNLAETQDEAHEVGPGGQPTLFEITGDRDMADGPAGLTQVESEAETRLPVPDEPSHDSVWSGPSADSLVTEGEPTVAGPEAMGEAQHTVLICEFGAEQTVVDTDLANLLAGLAARGVITVIGTGTTPAAALQRRLDEAISPMGYPCAIVVRLESGGGAHTIVDGRRLGLGPVKGAEPADDVVKQVKAQLADAVASAWATHVVDLRSAGAGAAPSATTTGMAQCCSAWAAVRGYVTALQSIIELLDVEPDALPLGFWLAVVTLTALQRLPDDLLVEQADVELLREAVIDIDTRFTDVPEEQYAADEARLNETWRTLRRRLATY